MLQDRIDFHKVEESEAPLFSIFIPSWNNLAYVKKCVESIRKHSRYHHQIIVHVNEGKDGTLEWIKKENLSYTHSSFNSGVCYGFNGPAALADAEYFVFIDDDMYVCPDWDHHLYEEVKKVPHQYFCISGTVVEHELTKNTCAIAPYDYGKSVEEFQEEKFLKEYKDLPFKDWSGSSWYPMVIHKNIWHLIGGLSVEFTPGIYSDPDFMAKLWHVGVRYYKGVSECRGYHFLSRSTSRVKVNPGRKQFALKWNMTANSFFKDYLKMGKPFEGALKEPKKEVSKSLITKLKIFKMKF